MTESATLSPCAKLNSYHSVLLLGVGRDSERKVDVENSFISPLKRRLLKGLDSFEFTALLNQPYNIFSACLTCSFCIHLCFHLSAFKSHA